MIHNAETRSRLEVPPWHAYCGCYGCRAAEAINKRLAKLRDRK